MEPISDEKEKLEEFRKLVTRHEKERFLEMLADPDIIDAIRVAMAPHYRHT